MVGKSRGAGAVGLLALTSCAQVLGLGDYKDGEGGAGGVNAAGGAAGHGGAQASISSTSTQSTGTAGSCSPGMTADCYDGPPGTSTVGNCAAGTHTCSTDGNGFGQCIGEQLPAMEDCAKTGDENCDGSACGDVKWAFGAGDSAYSNAYGIAQDPSGNTYAVGDFPGSLVLGATTLDSLGQSDIFVTKIDPSGQVLWAKRFGDSSSNTVLDVAATATHVYVLSGDPIDFGAGLGTGVTLAKLDGSTGAIAWSRSCNKNAPTFFADDVRDGGLVAEPGGNVYFAADIGGASVTCTSTSAPVTFTGAAGLVAKYTSGGDLSWEKVVSASSPLSTWDIALDPTGGLYLTGNFKGTASWGCSPMTASATGGNPFLVKLDSDGHCVRTRQWGDGGEVSYAVTVDGTGSPTVGGALNGTINFGGSSLSGTGVFVAHFNAQGTHQWSNGYVGSGSLFLFTLTADSAGDVFAGGKGKGLNFGNGALPSTTENGFLAKLRAADGVSLWSRGYSEAEPIDVSFGTRISVVGNYYGSTQLGSFALTAPGHDIFFMAVDP